LPVPVLLVAITGKAFDATPGCLTELVSFGLLG
jgi:hypothetical protein